MAFTKDLFPDIQAIIKHFKGLFRLIFFFIELSDTVKDLCYFRVVWAQSLKPDIETIMIELFSFFELILELQ